MFPRGLLTAVIPFHNFDVNFTHLCNLLDGLQHDSIQIKIICDRVSPSDFEFMEGRYSSRKNFEFHSVNFGSAAKTRNVGLQLVATNWVVFWDCDDKIQEGNYVDTLQNQNWAESDLIIGQIETFDNDKSSLLSMSRSYNLRSLATYPAFTRVIYRMGFIEGLLFPEIPLCEDQCFLASVLARNPRVEFTNKVFYRYRVNNPNQSSNTIFNVSSHISAVLFIQSLKSGINSREAEQTLEILKLRLILSTLKRSYKATRDQKLLLLKMLFQVLSNSPTLVMYSRPMVIRRGVASNRPQLVLTGGLGNQLFQYSFMYSQFKSVNFSINANLGDPRLSGSGFPEIYQFNISEYLIYSKRFLLRLKQMAFLFLLKVSSLGTQKKIGYVAFKLIDKINGFYALTHSGTGLIFLADGVGYFDPINKFALYRYYLGCFHSYKWAETLPEEFKLINLRLRKTPKWLSLLEEEIQIQDYCVVHIRRGDYLSIRNLGFLKLEYFNDIMKEYLSQGKAARFLIFTDDPEYVRKSLYSELLEVSEFVTADQNDASANLVAMHYGSSFILSNSTFSWWAAWMSNREDINVVVPKYWYADQRNPKDIYPPNWFQREIPN